MNVATMYLDGNSTNLSTAGGGDVPALGPALVETVLAATQHLATTAAIAASPAAAPAAAAGTASSDLAGMIDYLFDDVIGLDRSSALAQVTARRGTTTKDGDVHLTLELDFSLGGWPKALIDSLPSSIFSIDINASELARDRTKIIDVEAKVRHQLDNVTALLIDKAVSRIDGAERGVAVAATNALKNLLSSEIMKPLATQLSDSLLDLDLPDRAGLIDTLGDGFDAMRAKYFEVFVPEIAKTYAKFGLSEILTTISSGLEPKWASAISTVGNGVLGTVIDNVVNNYFENDPAKLVDPLHSIDFAETFGNAIAGLLVNFQALDKQIIDDILGIDGDGFLDRTISNLLNDGINDFVKDKFVDAIKFLAGEFEAADLNSLFSQFTNQFSIAQIQSMLGDFFVNYAGNQLAQLFVNIDSLPEALVSQLGSVIGSGVLGEAIGSITMGAVGDLFGVAAWGAVGTSIFNGLGAILGAGVGAIAGSVVFELLDDLFDGAISGLFNQIFDWIRNDSPQAFYGLQYNPSTNEFFNHYEYSKDSNNQMRAAVKALGDAFETRIDAILDFVGQQASFDPGYENIYMVWGKKHYDSKYASFLTAEANRLVQSSDPGTVVLTTLGSTLHHMNFNTGNPILAKAYEAWKVQVAAGGGGEAAYASANAFALLQNIVGLAHFANAYRQDPTGYDALMASDAPIAVTILQQYLEAQAMGFNGATILRGSQLAGEEIGSAAAGDTIVLDGAAWRAFGRGGNDTIDGGTRNDLISGGTGDDLLRGNAGADTIAGDEGDDKVYGGEGNDGLSGGAGDDIVLGDAGNDTLDGGAGSDQLFGYTGDDTILAGAGNDLMNGEDGDDTIDAGDGDDVVYGDSNQAGRDTLNGGAGNDAIYAGGGHDSVWGGAGDDWLDGGAGDDTIDGGPGVDTVTYAGAAAGVTIDLSLLEDQNTRGSGVDTLIGIENVIGSGFDDVLAGNALTNIFGGGAGDDRFVFDESALAARDAILDFQAGDVIDLSRIDANGARAGDAAFQFLGTAGFSGSAGQVRVSGSGVLWQIQADIDGDGSADLTIDVTTQVAGFQFTTADFFL